MFDNPLLTAILTLTLLFTISNIAILSAYIKMRRRIIKSYRTQIGEVLYLDLKNQIDIDSEEKAFLINTLEKDKISYDDCLRAKVFILKYTANNPPFT